MRATRGATGSTVMRRGMMTLVLLSILNSQALRLCFSIQLLCRFMRYQVTKDLRENSTVFDPREIQQVVERSAGAQRQRNDGDDRSRQLEWMFGIKLGTKLMLDTDNLLHSCQKKPLSLMLCLSASLMTCKAAISPCAYCADSRHHEFCERGNTIIFPK